jgi:mRNA interferase RelE/StbE
MARVLIDKNHQVALTSDAVADLKQIQDLRSRKAILNRLKRLGTSPTGKCLSTPLQGLFSVRAAGQRYRIVFKLVELEAQVIVLAIGKRSQGSRRDPYASAAKRIGVQ